MTLREAYRRMPLDELWKIASVVEDAVIRWEMRVMDEPILRERIRHGYECMALVQEVVAERLAQLNETDLH